MPKPKIKNPDGNIWVILGMAQRALRDHQPDMVVKFQHMTHKAIMEEKTDYFGMLAIVMQFVDIEIDEDEDNQDNE